MASLLVCLLIILVTQQALHLPIEFTISRVQLNFPGMFVDAVTPYPQLYSIGMTRSNPSEYPVILRTVLKKGCKSYLLLGGLVDVTAKATTVPMGCVLVGCQRW